MELTMKRFLSILLTLALVASVSCLAFSHTPTEEEKKAQKGERAYCCWGKGKCDKQHTKEMCEKEGGKVVGSCKDCK
jgi:hypothetical protein